MRYTPEQIRRDPSFVLLDELSHNDILGFAGKYLRKRNRTTTFFFAFLLGTLIIMALGTIRGILEPDLHTGKILLNGLYGFLASFTLVIPVHEGLHGLVYWFMGARKIHAGANIRQFAFFVSADHHVVDRKGFKWLAFTPFTVIGLLCIGGIYFFDGYIIWAFGSLLFWHATMCAGDFALVSYYEENHDKEIYTFDNVPAKISYFYEKRGEPPN